MDSGQLKVLAVEIASALGVPPWWSYPLMLILVWVAAFLGSYLSEKGKGLATKEDVENLTNKVEGIKRQHLEILEDLKAGHQLRMVAAERRLQAHQDAFALMREQFNAMHTKEAGVVAGRCLQWWERNCVFLGPKSAQAFYDALWAAARHESFLSSRAPAEAVSENWKKITSAPNVILAEVALPPLNMSSEEREKVTEHGRNDYATAKQAA